MMFYVQLKKVRVRVRVRMQRAVDFRGFERKRRYSFLSAFFITFISDL
jgi:hypothetical protein